MQTPPPAEDRLARAIASVTGLFLRITEAGFVFVAFIVLIYILLGADAGSYVRSVISNLTGLLGAIGPEALVGLGLVAALWHLASRRT